MKMSFTAQELETLRLLGCRDMTSAEKTSRDFKREEVKRFKKLAIKYFWQKERELRKLQGSGRDLPPESYIRLGNTADIWRKLKIKAPRPKICMSVKKQRPFNKRHAKEIELRLSLITYEERQRIWLEEVKLWRQANCTKSEYHAKHPEELKFITRNRILQKKITSIKNNLKFALCLMEK